jgi:hypothetical protein
MATRFILFLSLCLLLSTSVRAASPRSKVPPNVSERFAVAERSLEALHSIQVPKQCSTVAARKSCDAFRQGADTSISAVFEVRKALGDWQSYVCKNKVESTDCKQSAEALKSIDAQLEECKNKRQEFTTAFDNFDQKANQLFNILSTVLKHEKESMSSIVRNIN